MAIRANRVILLLSLSVFLFFASRIGLNSIITRYASYLGAGIIEAGAIFSIAFIISALLRIPIGILADRYGSMLFMMLGLAFTGIASLMVVISTEITQLYFVMIFQGLGVSTYIAPSIASATLLVSKKNQVARTLSYRSATISLALIASPPIVAWLVDNIGFPIAFLYILAIALSGLIPTYMLWSEHRKAGRTYESFSSNTKWIVSLKRNLLKRNVVAMISLAFLDGSVFIALQAIPQYEIAKLGLPATVYGIFLTLYGITSFVARITTFRLIGSINPINTILLGLSLEVVGITLLSMAYGPMMLYLFYLAGTLYGLGLGFLAPSRQYVLLSKTSSETRNTIASVYAVGFDIGGGMGTIVYSAIANAISYTAAYQSMALVELLGLFLIASLLRTRREKENYGF